MSEQKIIDAILGDAQRDAGTLLQKAKDEALAAQDAALADARRRCADVAAEAQKDAQELRRRALLNAGLAARKNALASRRALLDRAYAQAYETLCALPDGEYAALVSRLVAEAAEKGDERLLVPQRRLACCEKLLPSLNETMKKTGRRGALTAAASDAVADGVRLVGADADVDCSFAALVRAQRDAAETQICALLFGEKE